MCQTEFMSRWNMIIRANKVVNRTVESDERFDNLAR